MSKNKFIAKDMNDLVGWDFPKFKTPYNNHLFPKRYEINKQPSMTIPDQAMTITEILERHTRGIPFTAGKVPIYEGDEPKPDFNRMDLSEIQQTVEEAKEFIDSTKQKVYDKRKQKQEREHAELLEFRKSKSQPSQPINNTNAEPKETAEIKK